MRAVKRVYAQVGFRAQPMAEAAWWVFEWLVESDLQHSPTLNCRVRLLRTIQSRYWKTIKDDRVSEKNISAALL
jgi:hypothetical protein